MYRYVKKVTFNVKANIYRIISKPRPLPLILQISNHNNEDITNKILPHLGPNYDWYNVRLTPSILGEKLLCFELSNGTGFICLEHELLPQIQI